MREGRLISTIVSQMSLQSKFSQRIWLRAQSTVEVLIKVGSQRFVAGHQHPHSQIILILLPRYWPRITVLHIFLHQLVLLLPGDILQHIADLHANTLGTVPVLHYPHIAQPLVDVRVQVGGEVCVVAVQQMDEWG